MARADDALANNRERVHSADDLPMLSVALPQHDLGGLHWDSSDAYSPGIGDLLMADKTPNRTDFFSQRQRALSKWDTEDGSEPMQGGLPSGAESNVPPLTQTELVHLRIRVIALENMVMALLAQASTQQIDLARDMAAYILPRQGFTQHPLTVHASHQMVDLVERAGHFRPSQPPTR